MCCIVLRMQKYPSSLEQFLDELARNARAGDRLPTIRELMRRFSVSQAVVQRAFENLRNQGLIASQVGRGTHFKTNGELATAKAPTSHSPLTRSVLLLRRSFSVVRGRLLVEWLQRRFTAEGYRVLEVSYTDPDHARTVLKSLPQFDASVIQSTYRTITIDLLAALKEKSDVLAVDGAALVGTDVDAIGTEWGEPLAVAIEFLKQQGHRRIAYATTSHPFLANQLGLRRFEYLQQTSSEIQLHLLTIPHLPDDGYETHLVEMIKADLDSVGRPPFTALIAWGIEDGAKFRELLLGIGIKIPATLSVVLLGRTDVVNEHANFFDTIGCRVEDQVESLYQAITTRWADPSIPYGIRFTPVTRQAGASVSQPPQSIQPAEKPGTSAYTETRSESHSLDS